ncbi:MAG TPA: Lrp/AsnC family transcriptional regulator [Thermoanaerobaculia bacterium]|jgi:Lrp/AsnC family leucine-responsive transcriptional regulator|nr:Lrp/AsnC family transcriptional regulator [Thermoanaerobaculia bacterium]
MINDLDRQILTILQKNARTSNAEVARQVGLAPSAVFERIRKLEERGVLRSYGARIDPRAVGLPLVAFTFVRSNDRPGGIQTAEKLAEIPEVLEVHHVAGEDCFLVKVRAADTESLGRLLRERLGKIGTITSTRTTIVLETVKETVELPIAVQEEDEEVASA